MQENCSIFAASKPTEAESTIMPSCRSWLKERAMEIGTASDDHTVAIFMNMPARFAVSNPDEFYIDLDYEHLIGFPGQWGRFSRLPEPLCTRWQAFMFLKNVQTAAI